MARILYASVILLALTQIVPISLSAESETYRIAAIIPLSGQIASLGNYVKNGIELAISELSPEQRKKVSIVYEDDQFNPTNTISAYRRLNSFEKLDAVIVLGSPTAKALSHISENDETILIAIGASDATIVHQKRYTFIHWVTPEALGDKLVQGIINKDLKRIAFVVSEVEGAIAAADGVSNALKEEGKSEFIVYRQNFPLDQTDFRTALLRIKQRNADAVVVVLFPGSLSLFAKQFQVMQLPAELIGIETFEDEAEVKASNGALNGTWYANASQGTSEFVSQYRKRFGTQPGWGAANAYDTIKLISAATKQVGSSGDKISDFLRNVKNYKGAAGTYSATGDNRFTLPASLRVVTDKGFEDYPLPAKKVLKNGLKHQ